MQIKMVKKRFQVGSDETVDCGLVVWRQGVGEVEVELYVSDIDGVCTALDNQKTDKEEKERLFEIWNAYQKRVLAFLEKANAVINACNTYNADRPNWVNAMEEIKIPCGLSDDAMKLDIDIHSPVDLQVAQHMALELQVYPKKEYTLRHKKAEVLTVNVVLTDGSTLQNCKVCRDDLMGEKFITDKEEMESCFAIYPWGNEVRKMKVKGIDSGLEIVINPTMVKEWSYTEEK